ncbi:hypothetical protein J699_03419 [Acinetobacter sp. 1000160]|nr:hypothetical protein J522_2759 [Acinetobacter baumannii 146457]EYT15290.1 hypothetical protein J699_03419 [Acinetobacter sp. 1000160]
MNSGAICLKIAQFMRWFECNITLQISFIVLVDEQTQASIPSSRFILIG